MNSNPTRIKVFDQICSLEAILIKYEQMQTLLSCMTENYYGETNPESYDLQVAYPICHDLLHLVEDIVREQNRSLREAMNGLYKLNSEIKKAEGCLASCE